jgi:hypothetical protein
VVLLTKVTCTYSELEDRIRMSAMLKEGEPVVFWLTQRLSCRIVRALTAHLEKSLSQSALVDMGLLLSCQQRDAEWQHEPSEPVPFKEETLRILPEKVDLSCSPESAALLLHMNFKEMRQWLAIVHRQFKNAGWPMGVWPVWFTQAELGRN